MAALADGQVFPQPHTNGSPPGKRPTSLLNKSILIVDDDDACRDLYRQSIASFGATVDAVGSLSEFDAKLKCKNYDLVLMDLFLDHASGLDGIQLAAKRYPCTKIAVLSGHSSVDMAVEAMNVGAVDFLVKGTPLGEIAAKIGALLDITTTPVTVAAPSPAALGIIGESTLIRGLATKTHRIRSVDTTVLITGESGSGKELVARAIHQCSKRSNESFLAINCAAISETLLEAELFGYKRGSFTDAKKDRSGFFETASKGTLFLDEIGELSLTMQAKLLRVLQEREIVPIGSCYAIKVNTRVLAATNRNLLDEVRKGNFREDLYYRLSVLNFHVPPLRERTDDIPMLVRHFIDQFNHQFGKSVAMVGAPLLARLRAYPWPGNVRELRNAIERAVILAEGDQLQVEDLLPYRALIGERAVASDRSQESAYLPASLNLVEAKHAFEQHYLHTLLDAAQGNIAEAARLSGQYRANIYRMLKKHGISPEKS